MVLVFCTRQKLGLGKHLCGNGDFSRFPWKFQSPWERARFHRPRLAAHGLGGTRGCMHARAVTCAGVHERCDWRARERVRGGETAHPAGLWHMGDFIAHDGRARLCIGGVVCSGTCAAACMRVRAHALACMSDVIGGPGSACAAARPRTPLGCGTCAGTWMESSREQAMN